MRDSVTTIEDLEATIGKTPPPMHLKVIDHLDAGALDWIAQSPLIFATAGDGSDIAVTLGGGSPGFVAVEPGELRLPLALCDHPESFRPGLGFGSLFLLPGIRETLRVNGRVVSVDGGEARIAVSECYGHCAKALIRSDFWSAAPVDLPPGSVEDFVADSRFMALATVDRDGRADLSPKGDPAGTMALVEEGRLWFAERPGNRRADSLRNLIVQPRMAALLILPGSHRVARVSGPAGITTAAERRQRFAVKDKVPALVTAVEEPAMELYDSAALVHAGLWPMTAPASIDAPGIFLGHIKVNRDKSLTAKVASTLFSLPGMNGLMRKGLEKDYKDNLY